MAFALGCSHSFEDLLLAEGMSLRPIERGHVVPAFVTNVKKHGCRTIRWGPGRICAHFHQKITDKLPKVHGAPIHMGDAAELGIAEIESPDWGKGVGVTDKEIPLFWACGVTPQKALKAAGTPVYFGPPLDTCL
jgi:uncharacterized protein YcsI (UPF0317 family)